MSNNILKLSDVTMQFGGVVAVNNLSLEVNEGEIVSLIGPNGAGKTTVFNAITGVYRVTNGKIDFCGETISEDHPRGKMKKLYAGENNGKYTHVVNSKPDAITRAGIARTFQNIRLFKSMTVFDNVLTAKHVRLKAGLLAATFKLNAAEERRMREETLELLRRVGLEDVKDELATSLPYGKQRHLEIARALATEPRLLLLDEPAAGMNPQETAELTEFINRLRREMQLTIFVIEHHMNLVMDISDRIYVIDFGRQIAEGTPDEIQNNDLVIKAYLGVSDDE